MAARDGLPRIAIFRSGGFNSTLSVPVPALAPGASINVRFLFGVQATGSYKFSFTFEVLP